MVKVGDQWFRCRRSIRSLSISALPQQQLGECERRICQVQVTTDAFPGREFEGKLTAINSDGRSGDAQRLAAGDAR